MNDYKELLGRLRSLATFAGYGKESCVWLAVDAIEQLAKDRERDDEIIASLQKELVEVANERDAAIKDLKYVLNYAETMTHCKFCAHDKGPFETCDHECIDGSQFEYRGVRGGGHK